MVETRLAGFMVTDLSAVQMMSSLPTSDHSTQTGECKFCSATPPLEVAFPSWEVKVVPPKLMGAYDIM